MLPKNSRIITPSDFYKIKKFGKRLSDSNLSIVYLTENDLKKSIFSVIVSKTIAKKSSDRNKLKRIYKGLIIRNLSKIPSNIKCIVFPKFSSIKLKNSELDAEFLQIFKKI